jgi:hypothetical protein
MAEWLKAHAWKACIRETVSWVRIPLPPPYRNPAASDRVPDIEKYHIFHKVIVCRRLVWSIDVQPKWGYTQGYFLVEMGYMTFLHADVP